MDTPETGRGHRRGAREVAIAVAALRYRVTMKRPAPKLSKKLPVNRETIRSLAHLELGQVVGGADTGDVNCPLKAPVILSPGA